MADKVKFGRGRAVAVGAKVEADPFNSIEEEVAFLGVEREAPFGEDVADTREVQDKGAAVAGKKEDIVDDLAVARLD